MPFNFLSTLWTKNLEKSMFFWYYENIKKVLKSDVNYAMVKVLEIIVMGVDG